MTIAIRPILWAAPCEGFHFEPYEDEGWTLLTADDPRCCRYGAGPHKAACGAPAVVTLQRSNGPWAYCAEHMYGRWIEDGKILGWRMVKDDSRG